MAFTTDDRWTPATYRRAHAAWAANAPANDNEIRPRKAKTVKPKHVGLADEMRSLLRWRELRHGTSWTDVAANDNEADDDAPVLAALDSNFEIRPTIKEMMSAVEAVAFEERKNTDGTLNVVPVGGDIRRAPIGRSMGRKKRPTVIVKLGRLELSNGDRTERALILDEAGRLRKGDVRLPLGAIIKCGPRKAREVYTGAKGAANDNNPSTVGVKLTAGAPAFDFADPVAEADEARHIVQAVGEHARVLDVAIHAANFSDVGASLGYSGKTAERRGKSAVMAACKVLDAVLAA